MFESVAALDVFNLGGIKINDEAGSSKIPEPKQAKIDRRISIYSRSVSKAPTILALLNIAPLNIAPFIEIKFINTRFYWREN
jgi:hypothetical protein